MRSEPSALVIESAKAVSRRLRTTEHNHRRSDECTRHPGRPGTPKGTETNRRAGSSLPDHALAERRGHCRSQRDQPRPTQPNGDLDASIEVASNHRIGGLLIGAGSRRCCHHCRLTPQIPLFQRARQIQTLELGRRPLPLRILSVGYASVADGCPPSTSARSRSDVAITSDPQSGNAQLLRGAAETPSRRDRHDVIPTDPT